MTEEEWVISRSYAMLSVYGVSKERAITISNGIDVLATRYKKEINCLREEITDLKGKLEVLDKEI